MHLLPSEDEMIATHQAIIPSVTFGDSRENRPGEMLAAAVSRPVIGQFLGTAKRERSQLKSVRYQ
jgi:hypothetical protein